MKYFLFFIFIIQIASFEAQDIHLSQFYNSDHLLNPSKIGDYDGDFRFNANYRNQWRQIGKQPISTYAVAFDHMFFLKDHVFNAGVFVSNDRFTGTEFNLITNSNFNYSVVSSKIFLALAYGLDWRKNNFRFGLQGGLVTSSSDPTTQTFPGQWDYNYGDFNQATPSLETQLKPSQKYFDLNVGGQWTKSYSRFTTKIGFSLNHINRPFDSYFQTKSERLKIRNVLFSELNYTISEKMSVQPRILYMWTAKANDLILGLNFRQRIKNKTIPSVYYGLHYRHGLDRTLDALIPTFGFHYKKVDIGLNYDVNISSLSSGTDSRKGTFEFSLIYTGVSTLPKNIFLPCERY